MTINSIKTASIKHYYFSQTFLEETDLIMTDMKDQKGRIYKKYIRECATRIISSNETTNKQTNRRE